MDKNDRLNILIKIGDDPRHKRRFLISLASEDNLANFKNFLTEKQNTKAIIYAFRNGKPVRIPESEIDLVLTDKFCYWNVT